MDQFAAIQALNEAAYAALKASGSGDGQYSAYLTLIARQTDRMVDEFKHQTKAVE